MASIASVGACNVGLMVYNYTIKKGKNAKLSGDLNFEALLDIMDHNEANEQKMKVLESKFDVVYLKSIGHVS